MSSTVPSNASVPLQSAERVPIGWWIWGPGVAALGVLVTAWIVFMWPEWLHNPDLSHGLVTPVLFAVLVLEARRRGTQRWLDHTPAVFGIALTFLAAGLVALTAACFSAAALAWSNALVAFLLGSALTLFLLGALTLAGHPSILAVPLNWQALSACCIWVLSAPIPPGTYTRITVALQLAVTRSVLATLHLLGIPAQQNGNVIELATTSVGVEEACSGVRSLVSCVVAALFLSAMLVRRPGARAVLLLAAAPLAVGMNLVRSLTLTLLANAGVKISGALHDVTGFAVLGCTALILAAIARALSPQKETARGVVVRPTLVFPAAGVVFTSAAALALGIVLVFGFRTQPAPRAEAPPPDLAAILPSAVDGWNVETTRDLYRFSSTLKTDHLAQRTYLKPTATGVLQVTVYLAYWRAGQAPVSLVASHTPDACWPGAGWQVDNSVPKRVALSLNRPIAVAEHRAFKRGEFPQEVWFWHLYRGQPLEEVNPFSPAEMIGLVLRYGVRSEGDQLFVRISSNQPWNTFASEPLIKELFAHLQPLGL